MGSRWDAKRGAERGAERVLSGVLSGGLSGSKRVSRWGAKWVLCESQMTPKLCATPIERVPGGC